MSIAINAVRLNGAKLNVHLRDGMIGDATRHLQSTGLTVYNWIRNLMADNTAQRQVLCFWIIPSDASFSRSLFYCYENATSTITPMDRGSILKSEGQLHDFRPYDNEACHIRSPPVTYRGSTFSRASGTHHLKHGPSWIHR